MLKRRLIFWRIVALSVFVLTSACSKKVEVTWTLVKKRLVQYWQEPDIQPHALAASSQAQVIINSGHPSQPIHPASRKQMYTMQEKRLHKFCREQLQQLPGSVRANNLGRVCRRVKQLSGCQSTKGIPIYHFDKNGSSNKGKRILTIALIHGDEPESGSVARSWMSRLLNIDSRNTWRVVPVVNPDGWKKDTRTNANGVDLNRNFPSDRWEQVALKKWKSIRDGNPRRYPGPSGASETETRCLIRHFKDFRPDFIISIHTPLGLLDFDGPEDDIQFPPFSSLPWISLGTFPGSLGRYMWEDQRVPVMTIELKARGGVDKLERFDRLQDISGSVAIKADKVVGKDKSISN